MQDLLSELFPKVISDIIWDYYKRFARVFTDKGYLYEIVNGTCNLIFIPAQRSEFPNENKIFTTDVATLFINKQLYEFNGSIFTCLFNMQKLLKNWIFFQIAHVGTDLYFIGGQLIGRFQRNATTKVCKFNLKNHSWKKLTSMKYGRKNHGVVVWNENMIFAIGGEKHGYTCNRVEYYDIKQNKWIQVANMPRKHHFPVKATICNGEIYCLGATFQCFIIDKYNPVSDEWICRNYHCNLDMLLGFSIVSKHYYIYIFGGFALKKIIPRIKRYHIFDNTFDEIIDSRVNFGSCDVCLA